MSEELDERVEHMARALYDAYRVIGEVNPQTWDEMAAEPEVFGYTLAKYRKAADDALDTIEWVNVRFLLASIDRGDGGA